MGISVVEGGCTEHAHNKGLFVSLAAWCSLNIHVQKGSVLAMSGRPITDLKLPELKDLVIVMRGVVEWHDLGLQLGLPESKLALIDKHPVEDRLRMMLSEWLQYDPEASWEKLATALNKIGKNAIAANIRREFVSGPTAQSLEQEAKRCTCYIVHLPLIMILNRTFINFS